MRPSNTDTAATWEKVPEDIKKTFDKLGIPESEKKFFAGGEAQYDSEVIYSNIKENLKKQGVIFESTDQALKNHEDLFKKYFASVVPSNDNKFAALNTAVWSGGCISGDSLILKDDMSEQQIKDINEGENVLAVAEDGSIISSKVIAKIYSGKKEVYKINVGGRRLKATSNHKFLVKDGLKLVWKELKNIHLKEKIAIAEVADGSHNLKLSFSELEEKEEQGVEDTYDLQVLHANFIANKIVAHNSFIYVPKNVKLSMPLQAYFRINSENAGQFERTLIIADEGAEVTYIEGCTAPIYLSSSLHAAVVELVAMKDAHIRYITIQNWSKNVYNLVTQRAIANENAFVEWVDGNIGSKVNMKYPSIILAGEKAKGSITSIAIAGEGQEQDNGGKVFHIARNTSSTIISKSVSKGSGITTYRGLVHIAKNATNSKSSVRCDAILLDDKAKTNTYPYNKIYNSTSAVVHEATTSKISEEQLFYLMSRGIDETNATAMIVLGFIEPLARTLPLEYSLELKRLILLDTSNSIG
ncbi:MAG: Fe-S cluster assembly protein SufB [Candidatus Micrarchaeia archaeon]